MPSSKENSLKKVASLNNFNFEDNPAEATSSASSTNSSFGYTTNYERLDELNDINLQSNHSQLFSPEEYPEKLKEQLDEERDLRLFKKQSNQGHLSNEEIEFLQIKQRKMLFPTLKPLSLEIRNSIIADGIQNPKLRSQADLTNDEFNRRFVLVKHGIDSGNAIQIERAFNFARNDQTDVLQERLLKESIAYCLSENKRGFKNKEILLKSSIMKILNHYYQLRLRPQGRENTPFTPLPCLAEMALCVCDAATTELITPVFSSLQTLYAFQFLATNRVMKSMFIAIELQVIKLCLIFSNSTSCAPHDLRLFVDNCFSSLLSAYQSNLPLPESRIEHAIELSFNELHTHLKAILTSCSLLIPQESTAIPRFFKHVDPTPPNLSTSLLSQEL